MERQTTYSLHTYLGYNSEVPKRSNGYSPVKVENGSISSPCWHFPLKLAVVGVFIVLILVIFVLVMTLSQNDGDNNTEVTELSGNDCNITNDISILDKLAYQRMIDGDNLSTNKPKVILILSSSDENNHTICPLYERSTLIQKACSFTTDSSNLGDADAVIVTDENFNLIKNKTRNDQIWIYSKIRPTFPPANTEYEKLNFSYIASYSWNSNIPILPMYWLNSPLDQKLATLEYKNKEKTNIGLVAVVFSESCAEEKNLKIKYKKEILNLQHNNLTIEWLGGCGNPNSSDLSLCFASISTKYKFALSFEPYDEDYISERFFHPMINNIIPVVFGENNKQKYESIAPNRSFIYYRDYEPKEFMNLLKTLNEDENEYKSYFKWMTNKEGKFWSHSMWYCQVCGMLYHSQTFINCLQ